MTELQKFYKEHHICLKCGQDAAIPGKVLCYYCRSNDKESKKRYTQKHKDELKVKWKVRNKQRYDKLKSEGICVTCGKRKAAEGRSRCKVCLSKYARRRRDKRHESGVMPKDMMGNGVYCSTCGKEVEIKGEKLCNRCKANAQKSAANARKYITKTKGFYKPFIFGKREKT